MNASDRGACWTPLRRLRSLTENLSLGSWIIVSLAILSTAVVATRRIETPPGLVFWIFARTHFLMYEPMTEAWNARHPDSRDHVHPILLNGAALERRMQSGFLAGTPLPDLVEVEVSMASRSFKGPLEDVGFVDLTDLLHREGIYQRINEPSFGPWTSRGRIFGIPHDVHPVLLAYRSDLIEAAGIDMSAVETWDDFVRVLLPMVRDIDGDGYTDRYALNLWDTAAQLIEVLILQAGGALFDDAGRPVIRSKINARVVSTIVTWVAGPDRIAANAPDFDAAGNKMRIDGYVLCGLVPDWLTGVWREDIPQLEGKLKLMPLPAWEPGGRRTSVMGGTMMGVTRRSERFEDAWAFAKELYLSPAIAEALFRDAGIISPVKSNWSNPVYDEPVAYFSGQPAGRLFIEAAPDVPRRTSSPYNDVARNKVGDATQRLKAYAQEHGVYRVDDLLPEASRLLAIAQEEVEHQIDRNQFLAVEAP